MYRSPYSIAAHREYILNRPRGGAFSPPHISGLKLWLKADAITGVADGGAVTTWEDSSGEGNDATQATAANKPTLQTNELNDLPVVRFDGTDDKLEIAAGNSFNAIDTNLSFFMVLNKADVADFLQTIVTITTGIGWQLHHGNVDDGSATLGVLTSGGTANGTITGLFDETPHILSIFLHNGSRKAWVDGTSKLDTTYTHGDGFGNAGLTNIFNGVPGDAGEIIAYDTAVSTANHNKVLTYLSGRWGISVTLL